MYIYIHTHIFITPSRLKLGVLRVEMSSVHGSRHEAEHCRERLKPQSYATVLCNRKIKNCKNKKDKKDENLQVVEDWEDLVLYR